MTAIKNASNALKILMRILSELFLIQEINVAFVSENMIGGWSQFQNPFSQGVSLSSKFTGIRSKVIVARPPLTPALVRTGKSVQFKLLLSSLLGFCQLNTFPVISEILLTFPESLFTCNKNYSQHIELVTLSRLSLFLEVMYIDRLKHL